MTDAPRCRYNLDARCPTDGLLDRIAALEVAARGYRERAERAEALLASHARPVASGDAGSPRDALGDTPAPDRAAAGIVTTAHYCRCATLGLVCGHYGRMGA